MKPLLPLLLLATPLFWGCGNDEMSAQDKARMTDHGPIAKPNGDAIGKAMADYHKQHPPGAIEPGK